LRVILVAGLCAVLLPAAVASAGSFKNGTGSLKLNSKTLKKLKKKGVKAGKSVSFSYSSGAAPFIQINMVNGQATNVSLGGSLKIKAGKNKVTLKNFRLNGGVLSAKLGSKTLGFPVSGGSTTTPPAPHSISVTVSGVNVKLTKAGAKALNKALSKKGVKVNAFKPGKFATLGYTGTDRQLLEIAGSGPNSESVTCENSSASAMKDQANKIQVSVSGGATPALPPTCTGPGYGAHYPAADTGVVDGLTGFGHIDVVGTVTTTCTDATNTDCHPGPPTPASAVFSAPEFIIFPYPLKCAHAESGDAKRVTWTDPSGRVRRARDPDQ
jgi:hypothetical protein